MKTKQMKASKWERMGSLLNEEVVYLLVPIVIVCAIISLITSNNSWAWPVGLIFIYIVLTMVRLEFYKSRSFRNGLQYFYVVPIHGRLAQWYLRKRLPIDQHEDAWRLHVNRGYLISIGSVRQAIQNMTDDILTLTEWDWGNDPVLIGSTYANLGRKQIELIRANADVRTFDGPMVPFQKWMVTRMRFVREQQKMFGRLYSLPAQMRWKTYVIWPGFKRR